MDIRTEYRPAAPIQSKPAQHMKEKNTGASVPKDSFELSGTPPEKGNCAKVFGAVGAAVGATAGRTILPALGVAGGILAGTGMLCLGPVGVAVAGIAGLALGATTEILTKAGRIAGGMAGGAVGYSAGIAADKKGVETGEVIREETKNFSLKSLLSKLKDPSYTKHEMISAQQAAEIVKTIQPGDLIIGNNDKNMNFELFQKVIGASGNWTHVCIVKDEHTVMETLVPALTDRALDAGEASERGYEENSPESMIMRNHHLTILRPRYAGPESIEKVIETGQAKKDVKYDMLFNMSSDDKMYCTEFVYKVLNEAAPELALKPSALMGIRYVTADDFINNPNMETVYNTGSDFWMNYLGKFC